MPNTHPFLLIIAWQTVFDLHNYFEAPILPFFRHSLRLVEASEKFKNCPCTPDFWSIYLLCAFRNLFNVCGNFLTSFFFELHVQEKRLPRTNFRVMKLQNCHFQRHPKLSTSSTFNLSQADHQLGMLLMPMCVHGGGVGLLEGCEQSGGGGVIVAVIF